MVKRVRDGGSGGFYSVDVVAAIVVNSGAKVKCAVTVVGPAWQQLGGGLGRR